mgnify:FL=1
MRHHHYNIIVSLLLLLLCTATPLRAQFFSFGLPDEYAPRQQQQRETVEPAKYKGGIKGLNRFLEKEFRQVESARTVDGTIYIVCEITAKGRIGDYQIRRSLGRELDAEAVRVLKKLKFSPARRGKKKVSSQINITFPIRHGRVSFLQLQTVDV